MTTEAITPPRKRMIEDMNERKLCAGTQTGHIRASQPLQKCRKRIRRCQNRGVEVERCPPKRHWI